MSPDERSGRQPATATCLGVASAKTEGRKPGDGKSLQHIIAPANKEYFLDSTTNWILFSEHGTSVPIKLSVIYGTEVPCSDEVHAAKVQFIANLL